MYSSPGPNPSNPAADRSTVASMTKGRSAINLEGEADYTTNRISDDSSYVNKCNYTSCGVSA